MISNNTGSLVINKKIMTFHQAVTVDAFVEADSEISCVKSGNHEDSFYLGVYILP